MIPRKFRPSIPAPAFPRVLFSKAHKPALSSTAWIDGVRGLAALIVTTNHMLFNEVGTKYHGYHAEPSPSSNASLLQLPPFRILFAMHAMVPLFFVISGYCLSLSFIRQRTAIYSSTTDSSAVTTPATASNGSTKRNLTPLHTTLSSALFRRTLRLAGPVLAITLLSHLLLYLRLYDWGWWDNPRALALSLRSTTPPPSLADHLSFLANYLGGALDAVLNGAGGTAPPGLNPQLWTIPAELRGSLVVYGCLLALAGVRDGPRCGVVAGLAGVLLVGRGAWEAAAFVGGLGVAEVEGVLEKRGRRSSNNSSTGGIIAPVAARKQDGNVGQDGQGRGRWKRAGAALLWAVGVYLLCTPVQTEAQLFSPCYAVLRPLTPRVWIDDEGGGFAALSCWRSIGGVAFVAGMCGCRALQRPFELPAVQYFGKISFMLYLVHQLVIRTLLRRFRAVVMACVGSGSPALVTFFTASATLVVMFWASEILVEVLDKRSVTMAKRLLERWSER
ncbi:acyltransferase 3 [Macrophomina phaseolina]|uniref:Acyltransferase 3 n=1 Tax=Macrophomina phaseolina TaxID=35725 RepID=A0ABQ8GRD5_9PEZI|nr:acyltransferase 3 [Macrophomina phaseolina]